MLPLRPENNYQATMLLCGGNDLKPDQCVAVRSMHLLVAKILRSPTQICCDLEHCSLPNHQDLHIHDS